MVAWWLQLSDQNAGSSARGLWFSSQQTASFPLVPHTIEPVLKERKVLLVQVVCFKFKAQFVIFLIQRDNSLARMLFASLFKSVFAEVDHVLTNREAESTKRAVRDGLNAVMEASTQFYPPFIGSLQVSLEPEVWER